MRQLENIIIYVLLLLIGFFYIRNRKKEKFVVNYQPYYPISNEVNPKFDNYNNSVDDKRLDTLKKSLDKVKSDANEGLTEPKQFNIINLPTIKKSLELKEIKPVVDFILSKANVNLGSSHTLILDSVKDINKIETEREVKINFKLVCDHKIKETVNYKVESNVQNKNKSSNKLVIMVEILSEKTGEKEQIYINFIQITGITSGNNLPGKNYYDNSTQFMFSDIESNKIIEKKNNLNSNEVNNLNKTIPEEDPFINEITMDESNEESFINTEEAESFFNI